MNSVVYAKGKVAIPAGAIVITPGNKLRKAHILYKGVEHKHCACCDNWVSIDWFYSDMMFWDGLHQFCKDCTIKIARKE